MALRVSMQDQDGIAAWAAPRMGLADGDRLPDDMIMLGIYRDDDLVGAVGFNAFYGDYASIHVASDGKRNWLNRKILRAVFGYPFQFRNLRRLNLVTARWNRDAQILALKCGGIPEGYMRKANGNGEDAVIFGILREECPYFSFFDGGHHGEERA